MSIQSDQSPVDPTGASEPGRDDPDRLRAEIEATRSDLSANVNALVDTARPGNVARRQVDKVGDRVGRLKDSVMGTSGDVTSSAGDSVSGAAHSVKDAATSAPSVATSRTRGNPLAAGLIAFGAGWLVGSLLPATGAERQAADAVKEKAQPLVEQATDAAKSVASDLKEPATEAVESVKGAATDAAGTVKEEATSTASDVAATGKDAAGEVRS